MAIEDFIRWRKFQYSVFPKLTDIPKHFHMMTAAGGYHMITKIRALGFGDRWETVESGDDYLTLYQLDEKAFPVGMSHYVSLDIVDQLVRRAEDRLYAALHKRMADLDEREKDLERKAKELDERERAIAVTEDKPTRQVSTVGYVYVLRSESGLYKIGRTSNPNDRLRTFSVKLPFEVEYTCLIPTENMYELESSLHYKYKDVRVNGEWFRLSPDQVSEISHSSMG